MYVAEHGTDMSVHVHKVTYNSEHVLHQQTWGCIYMHNMTDMTVIDPPSTFAYSAYYLSYYLTYYAYGFRGYILFYIYMSNNMTKDSAGSIFVIFCILQYAEYDILYAEYTQ